MISDRNNQRAERVKEEIAYMLSLPKGARDETREFSVSVNAFSTISINKAIYFVPTRFIGLKLRAQLNHEELFPRLVFRQAYDVMEKAVPEKCDKEYLRILHQTALGEETIVALALQEILAAGEFQTVKMYERFVWQNIVPDVEVLEPQLNKYDQLLKTKRSRMSGTTRQSELESLLTSFRLPAFTKSYQQFARQAEKEKIDHVGAMNDTTEEPSDCLNKRNCRKASGYRISI